MLALAAECNVNGRDVRLKPGTDDAGGKRAKTRRSISGLMRRAFWRIKPAQCHRRASAFFAC